MYTTDMYEGMIAETINIKLKKANDYRFYLKAVQEDGHRGQRCPACEFHFHRGSSAG